VSSPQGAEATVHGALISQGLTHSPSAGPSWEASASGGSGDCTVVCVLTVQFITNMARYWFG
jgi:hypothetical protein